MTIAIDSILQTFIQKKKERKKEKLFDIQKIKISLIVFSEKLVLSENTINKGFI